MNLDRLRHPYKPRDALFESTRRARSRLTDRATALYTDGRHVFGDELPDDAALVGYYDRHVALGDLWLDVNHVCREIAA